MVRQNFLTWAVRIFLTVGSSTVILGTLLNIFSTFDQMSFAFSLGMTSLTLGLTLEIVRIQDNFGRHQSIGGYFPSRDLDLVIHDYYILFYNGPGDRKPHGLKKPAKYTRRRKDAERLISLLPTNQGFVIENIARRSYTCTYKCGGKTFSATSASREMAICIAFLRSCGYSGVKCDK